MSRKLDDYPKKQPLLPQEDTSSPEVPPVEQGLTSATEIFDAELQKELEETRDKFVIFHDFAPNGYATLDQEGTIIEANLTLANLLGVDKTQLINSTLKSYLIQGSQETFENFLEATLKIGSRQKSEVRFIRKGGQAFFAELISMPIRDNEGKLKRIHTSINDISNFKNLLEQERIYKNIVDTSPDAIISTDKELNITVWNQAAQDLFGWKAAEVCSRQASQPVRRKLIEPLINNEVMSCLSEKGSWSGEVTCQRKDGSKFETGVKIGVLWDSAGNFNGMTAVYQTGTAINEAALPFKQGEADEAIRERLEDLANSNRVLQQELNLHKQNALLARESEGRNRDLVDNIKLGIFRCTPGIRGKFMEVNKAMEEISGYSREELLLMDVCKLYSWPKGKNPFTNEVNISDWKVTQELNLKRKDGREVMVSMTIVALRFDSGVTQYFDGILEDITERKQAQQQIQQSLLRLQTTIREIIEAMAYIGEIRDPYTAGHQRRVASLSFEIGKLLGLRDEEYEGLTMAAFVHDIGKILVPADILSKPGKLTKPEYDMLRDHTRIGYEILKTIEFPWPIAKIVLQHHERINGSGYPSGLTGGDIILEARILAVADVVEAMSSHRPYRPALGIDKALEEINVNRGVLYDSAVVDACMCLFKEKGYSLS